MKVKFAKVSDQYKKFPELEKKDVTELLEWVNGQPHLPLISELEAIFFLHSNYYQMDAAKKTIENYYTCRTKFTDFFEHRNIQAQDMKTVRKHLALVPLPQRTKAGYKICMSRFLQADHRNFDANSFYKLIMYISDAFLMEEGAVEGIIIVADMQDMNLGYLSKFGILGLRRFLYYLQEALPFRLKGLHFINVNPIAEKLLLLVKPMMKRELREILEAHSKMDSVYKFIDPEVFPSNFPGGKAPPIEELHETTFNHLLDFEEYFMEEERTRRVDDHARVTKQKSFWKMF